jgi:glyoxylase-like metal-dependent hydrolase (beta-lactamase superfamily II)
MRYLMSLLLLPLAALAEPKYAPVDVDMQVRKVGEHSYYVQGAAGAATYNEGFVSNAGFVVTDAGVVVVDALGSPSLGWALRRKIAEITDQPVVRVVMTHYHADHIYGLQVFKDEGAEILAPKGAYEYLDSEAASNRIEERRVSLFPWVDENTRLVRPDRIVAGPDRFSLGGLDFKLDYLGAAHSDGDMAMYVVQDGVLYSGDIIFEGRVPFVGDADTRHWLETLNAFEAKGVTALVPGHGPAAEDPQAAIALTRDYLARLREVMGAAIENLDDFETALDSGDWSEFADLPAFDQAHRINAYRVYLSMEAEALAE